MGITFKGKDYQSVVQESHAQAQGSVSYSQKLQTLVWRPFPVDPSRAIL